MSNNTRLDVLAVTVRTLKDGTEKTFWSRCGVAFQTNDGSGWNVTLDSLPVSGKLLLSPPKERNNGPRGDDVP